jgi:hypothetical protein
MAEEPRARESITGFDYYVVRLNRSPTQSTRLSGLIERLATGEKRWFDTGELLVQLVTLWSFAGADGPDARAAVSPPSRPEE